MEGNRDLESPFSEDGYPCQWTLSGVGPRSGVGRAFCRSQLRGRDEFGGGGGWGFGRVEQSKWARFSGVNFGNVSYVFTLLDSEKFGDLRRRVWRVEHDLEGWIRKPGRISHGGAEDTDGNKMVRRSFSLAAAWISGAWNNRGWARLSGIILAMFRIYLLCWEHRRMRRFKAESLACGTRLGGLDQEAWADFTRRRGGGHGAETKGADGKRSFFVSGGFGLGAWNNRGAAPFWRGFWAMFREYLLCCGIRRVQHFGQRV